VNEDRRCELERFFDGELPDDHHARVTRELAADKEAARYLETLGWLRDLARRHDPIASSPASRSPIGPWSTAMLRPWRWAALASLAACFLALAWWAGRRSVPPMPGSPSSIAAQSGTPNPVISGRSPAQERSSDVPRGRRLRFATVLSGHRAAPSEDEVLALDMANAPPEASTRLSREAVERLTEPAGNPHSRARVEPPAASSDPLAEAKGLMGEDEWGPAIKALRRLLDRRPDADQATESRFWLGYCLVKDEEFAQAILALQGFEAAPAGSKWTDDALLQIGHAYRGEGERERALGAWKRLLADHPGSVWIHDALLGTIQLLYFDAEDYAACLPYCERLLQSEPSPDESWEARRIGAFCLNATRRFDDAGRWIDRWFDPGSPSEEAWRTLLGAQKDLLRGRVEEAVTTIHNLRRHFPDLDLDGWLDILVRASSQLRQNGQAARARALMSEALYQLSDASEEQVGSVLDELETDINSSPSYQEELARIAADLKTPVVTRAAARGRLVAELREEEKSWKAAELLRESLARDEGEFLRSRAALLLGEILADDLHDRAAASVLLTAELPKLHRRDHIREFEARLKEWAPPRSTDARRSG
jgi:tetratricopeptide (TPR) repeat protein